MLIYLGDMLKRKWSLTLWFLDWGVPSSYLFLKLDMSRIALTFFHKSTSASFDGYFDLMMLYDTVIGVPTSTMSW